MEFVLNALKVAKHDSRLIPAGVKLMVLVIFIRSFSWGFVDPFYSIYLNSLSNSYTMVGAITSLFGLFAVLTIIPLMSIADKVKDSRMLRDGELLYFLVILGYVFAGIYKNLWLLLITIVLNAIAQQLIVIGSESYIRRHNKGGDARSFGYYTAFDFFGWVLGMVIGSYTIRFYDLNQMFLMVIPSVIASLFILPFIHEKGISSMMQGIKKYFHNKKDLNCMVQDIKTLDPKVHFFLLIAFFDGFVRIFVYIFLPLYALSIGLNLSEIALFLAIMYIPFVFSFFFSEVSDRKGKMNSITMGLVIASFSFVMLSLFVGQSVILVLSVMTSLSLAILRPAYNGAITRLTPRRIMGEVTGLNNLVIRLGMIVGPIVTGLIADKFGIQATFTLVAIVAFVLAIVSFFLRKYELILNPEHFE